MRVPFLDLSRQVAAMRAEIDNAITTVVDSGRFVMGSPVEEFEHAFADSCGAQFAVGVASGTDAISIALMALGVGPGDEVIAPANTCVPTVAAIEAIGSVPVLADVDPATYTLDPEELERLVGARTRAIVPVHLYGQCADMAPIREFAAREGLVVVEDAAQAHGSSYGGQRVGTLGHAAAFSFYPTKNLGALGDAGAVVTNDPAVAEAARQLRSYGERSRYESVRAGWNSRLDALQASVLLAKLPHLLEWTHRRREIASRLCAELADLPLGLPREAPGRVHVYHLFVVTVPDRDRFRERLEAEGVGSLIHYARPIHRHAAYVQLAPPDGTLEQTERLAEEIVSLPLYPELLDDEVEAVAAAVRRSL